jgi:hypothetical protein
MLSLFVVQGSFAENLSFLLDALQKGKYFKYLNFDLPFG